MICLSLCLGLLSCQPSYRVFNETDLSRLAISEYGFSDITFIKTIDRATAHELTGVDFDNSCLLAGKIANEDKWLFIPRKLTDTPVVLDFPYAFSFEDILNQLSSLKDSNDQPLYQFPLDDFGGLSVGIDRADVVRALYPEDILDTPIIISFETPTEIFLVFSVEGTVKIAIQDLSNAD